MKLTNDKIPMTKFTLFLTIFYLLSSIFYLFAADLQVETGGKLKTDTVTFNEQTTAPAHKTSGGGRVYYDDDNRLYISDGADWNDIDDAKTVATRIVGVDRGGDGVAQAGDSNLVGKTADYICDGTADQVQIQQAIDDLGSNGGAVYLLEGTYNISSPIVFNNTAPVDSNKALIGAGAGTLLQTYDSPVITASNVSGILISQLKINGSAVGSEAGISFSGVTESKIDKVWVETMGGDGIYLANSSNNNTISGNNCQWNGFYGIWLLSSSNNTLSGNNCQGNGAAGISLYSSSNNNTISGNNCQGNGAAGISLYSSSNNNTISGNNVQLNGAGIQFYYGSSNNTISGNNVQSNGAGIQFYYGSSNNTISGNNVQSNGFHGIQFYSGSSNNTISGNTIYDNGGTGGYDGIMIYGNSDNNLISANRISDTAGPSDPNWAYMINIKDYDGIVGTGDDCNNNYIVGNELSLPTTYTGNLAKISDSGAGTTYTGKDKITLERQIENITTSTYTLDIATNPRSYVVLNPAVAVTALTLANGKSAGDLLILENDSINPVTINEASNVDLLGASGRILGQYDTLKLIWNGDPTTPKWIEVAFSNN